MKLLFLYGSPAVGKLTTAGEVAKLTDFRVFHNHLTINAVKPVFDFGTASFWRLVHLFRIETVAEAARENINLIYTYCYAKDADDKHVAEIVRAVEDNGGEVCFVLLTADKSVIEKRVTEESRKAHGKPGSAETLRGIWEKYELFLPVNGHESLVIDNSEIPAEQAARQIVAHFDLAVN